MFDTRYKLSEVGTLKRVAHHVYFLTSFLISHLFKRVLFSLNSALKAIDFYVEIEYSDYVRNEIISADTSLKVYLRNAHFLLFYLVDNFFKIAYNDIDEQKYFTLRAGITLIMCLSSSSFFMP